MQSKSLKNFWCMPINYFSEMYTESKYLWWYTFGLPMTFQHYFWHFLTECNFFSSPISLFTHFIFFSISCIAWSSDWNVLLFLYEVPPGLPFKMKGDFRNVASSCNCPQRLLPLNDPPPHACGFLLKVTLVLFGLYYCVVYVCLSFILSVEYELSVARYCICNFPTQSTLTSL